ncbi:hypothetical protein NX059_002176 [Plenodomus lindquistii]|nr:hypothetical protein NX059_002176 [Plenodomus lindquistii]
MAKSRPVDAPAQAKERQPIMPGHNTAKTADEFGEDAWAVGPTCRDDVCEDGPVKTHAAGKVQSVKVDDDDDNEVALPTPIAQGMWKVTAPDGREVLTYQPIPGFEHLLHGHVLSQKEPGCHGPIVSHQPSQHAAPTPESATCPQSSRQAHALPKQKGLKRCRSVACRPAPHQPHTQHDDEDSCDDDTDIRTSNETAHTFYVGDIDHLSKFYRRRLEELTMKPLRPIVTAWIKQLEPRRLGSYGPYHKKMPSQRPPQCTPDWWPRDVRYEEPSHLDKTGLLKVAVTMMLQHRIIDEPKRKGSWVQKLQQAAQYAIETTPPEQFSSSKGSGFGDRMRERALKEILPSLFSVAQIHEDHLAQYNLYEGTGNVDTRQGTMCTWQPVSRPPRQSTSSRKRVKVQSRATRPRDVSEETISGAETEVDDAVSNTFLRRQRARSHRPQRTPTAMHHVHSSAEALSGVTSGPAPSRRNSTVMATPASSFDRTMTGLCLEDNADCDVKYIDPAHFSNSNMMCNMFALGQPMPYSVSQTAFGTHGFHGQENAPPYNAPANSPFMSGPGYNTSFTTFNMPYAHQIQNGPFPASLPGTHHHGFPYEYDGAFPAVSDSQHAGRPFNGLPADLEDEIQSRGQFPTVVVVMRYTPLYDVTPLTTALRSKDTENIS